MVVLIKNTDAWLGQDGTAAPTQASSVKVAGDTVVDAQSAETLNSVVVGFGVGGDAGLAGSANVYSLTGSTLAGVGAGDTVAADGNVAVLASDQNSVQRVVGSAAGGGTAGIGASLGVSVTDQTTQATIGDDASVTALGETAPVDVTTGYQGVFSSYTGSAAAPTSSMTGVDGDEADPVTVADAISEGGSLFVLSRTADPVTAERQGVIVNATSTNAIRALSASGAAAGTAAVTLSGDLPVVIDDTEATVGSGAKLNDSGASGGAQQSVTVAAASDLYHVGIAGSASGAGTVGVGAGAEVNVVDNTTKAEIGDNAIVNAAHDVSVTANASEDFAGTAATLAASARCRSPAASPRSPSTTPRAQP